MKLLVIEQPITDLFNVDAVSQLDKHINTCDWVAAYETSSGLIAKLCSYKPDSKAWIAGFKYVNPSSQHQRDELYFQAHTHVKAIKNAICEKREVHLFNCEREFLTHFKHRLTRG